MHYKLAFTRYIDMNSILNKHIQQTQCPYMGIPSAICYIIWKCLEVYTSIYLDKYLYRGGKGVVTEDVVVAVLINA